MEVNGNTNAQQSVLTTDPHYEAPNIVIKKVSQNHVGNSIPSDFQSQVYDRPRNITHIVTGEKGTGTSDLDKKRLQFRRSPSYTNAISVDNDKDVDTLNTAKTPHNFSEPSPKRCPSYSQAVEESPVITKRDLDKHNTKTKYFDGKYYVGVVNDTDDSAL